MKGIYNLYKKNQTRNPKKPFKYSDLMSDDEDIIFSSHSNPDESETSDESSEDENAQSDEIPNQTQAAEEYLKLEENVEIPNYAKGEIIEESPAVSGKANIFANTDKMSANTTEDEPSSDAFSRMEKSLKKLEQASDSHPKMAKTSEADAKTGDKTQPVIEGKSDKNDLMDSKSDITDYSYYLIDPNVEHEQRNRSTDVPEHEQERSSAPDVPPRKYRRL